MKIGPDIIKNNPVMPKSTTSLSVVIRCLLSNACLIFSSNSFLYYSLSYCTYSFISLSASYSYSCTASRLSGSVSYSRAYAGVLATCIYFTMQKIQTYSVLSQPYDIIIHPSYFIYIFAIIHYHWYCLSLIAYTIIVL